MTNARISRMVREIEAEPAFQLFDTLFGVVAGLAARVSRVAASRAPRPESAPPVQRAAAQGAGRAS